MKKIVIPAILAVTTLAFAQTASAAAAAKPMSAQQSKFAARAHKSKGMKGAVHKKFMRDCLKGKDTPAKPAPKSDKCKG